MTGKFTDPRVAAFAELLERLDAFHMRDSADGSYEKAGQLLADFNTLAADCGIADILLLRVAAAVARFGDPAADINNPEWELSNNDMEAGRQLRIAVARALIDLAGGLIPKKVAEFVVADMHALANGYPPLMPIPAIHGNKSPLHREAAYQQLFLRAHYEAARAGAARGKAARAGAARGKAAQQDVDTRTPAWVRWIEAQKLPLPLSGLNAFRERNKKIPTESRERAQRLGRMARKKAKITPEDEQWLKSSVTPWPPDKLVNIIRNYKDDKGG